MIVTVNPFKRPDLFDFEAILNWRDFCITDSGDDIKNGE